jgi:hypothetical protein
LYAWRLQTPVKTIFLFISLSLSLTSTFHGP